MKLNREEFRGTRNVIGFTLKQYAKNKVNRIVMCIFIVLALISVPVISLIMGGKVNTEKFSGISKVYIDNSTDYVMDADSLGSDKFWSKTQFSKASFEEKDAGTRLSENEAFAAIALDVSQEIYTIKVSTAEDTKISETELSNLEALLNDNFTKARYKALGATDKQLSIVMSPYNVESTTLEKYNNDDEGPGMGTVFVVQYAYAIAVFMLCLFSTIYIIQAVIEEKSSKLVELLMVSIKPLALITGKILAVMIYTFTTTLMLLAAAGVSYMAGGMLTGTGQIDRLINSAGLKGSFMNISPMTIVIVLVSLIIAYFTLAIIGGISGTCCSSMEDMQSANMSVTMIVMAGYLVSVLATPLSAESGSTAVAIAVSLVPLVSIFCAPVQYVCGNISIYILLLSWAIQIGMIALLSVLCSRVYETLIIHKGSRVKLKELLYMAGLRKAKEVE